MFSENSKALTIELSDSKKTISRLTGPYTYAICCFDKPLDAINSRFFVKINSNINKKLWLGACILDVVRKLNFVSCYGMGKGTYAINQSIASAYNNPEGYATYSNHHLSNYNSSGGYNSTSNAVNNCLILGLDFQIR